LSDRHWFIVCSLTVITAAGGSVPASARDVVAPAETAPDREAEARRLFRQGLTHADEGRWSEASDCFTRAYAIRPTPQIAYNLSTALVRMGRLVKASQLLDEITADTSARPAVRQAAHARLDEVRPRLPRLTVRAPDAQRAHLWLDGQPVDPAVSVTAMPVDPGPHLVELRVGPGTALSRTVSLEEGARQTVIFEPPGPALAAPAGVVSRDLGSAPPPASSRESLLRRPWFWAAVGSAVLASAVVVLASRGGGGPEARGNVDTWVLPR
jgi:uncharacterized protein (UPF0147 family)